MSSNKYAALSTLGLGLMQWGASHSDRQLRAKTLEHEQNRNTQLDKLAAQQADRAHENAGADRELKRLQIDSQSELNASLGKLHGANAGKTAAETGQVAPEAEANINLLGARAENLTADTAKTTAETGEIAANAEVNRELLNQKIDTMMHDANMSREDKDLKKLALDLEAETQGMEWNNQNEVYIPSEAAMERAGKLAQLKAKVTSNTFSQQMAAAEDFAKSTYPDLKDGTPELAAEVQRTLLQIRSSGRSDGGMDSYQRNTLIMKQYETRLESLPIKERVNPSPETLDRLWAEAQSFVTSQTGSGGGGLMQQQPPQPGVPAGQVNPADPYGILQ